MILELTMEQAALIAELIEAELAENPDDDLASVVEQIDRQALEDINSTFGELDSVLKELGAKK